MRVVARARAVSSPGVARKNAFISAIALAAAALSAAACSGTATAAAKAASASSGPSGGAATSGAPSALTVDRARQVFDDYVSKTNRAMKAGDKKAALALAWGVQFHQESATLLGRTYRGPYRYGQPSFILPSPQASYPRWFAVSVRRTAPPGSPSSLAGVPQPSGGQMLLTFEKQNPVQPWQLTTSIQLQPGQQVPALAKASGGAQIALLDDTSSYLVRPDLVGPLQSAVVDDGPSNPSASVVASGPLTTGLYSIQSAIKPTPGDIRQWALEGSSYNRFALRMANGGALVFYSQSLNCLTEVPAELAQSASVSPGKPIAVPADFAPLLSPREANPRVKLETQYSLAFVAIDPPASAKNAKIQIIGMGGSPSSAEGRSHG